jgi:hypothetical protein
VCESGRGSEGKLEGLLEKETAEDHEVVSIAVLWLHDCSSLETRGVHEDYVIWFAKLVVGI